jgi:hypothetical protein
MGNELINIETITSKLCMDILRNRKLTIPHQSILKWEDDIPNMKMLDELNWRNIYMNPYYAVRETKLQSLQYKLIYRIINCQYKLHTWNIIDSSICLYCPEVYTIMHFFIYCNKVRYFWKYLLNWWNQKSDMHIDIYRQDLEECILFGFPSIDIIFNVLNLCILNAKQYIYVQRLFKNNDICFFEFLPNLLRKIKIEYNFYKSKNKNLAELFNSLM